MKVQKVTPFLWFNNEAAEAASYYASVFKNSKVLNSSPMITTLDLEGLQLMFLNGGPTFKLNEAFSLFISCENQEEIDYFWDTLTTGGAESQCGWLVDKFGVSWQVVPSVLSQLMSDPERAGRVVQAFMKMKKMNIEALMNA